MNDGLDHVGDARHRRGRAGDPARVPIRPRPDVAERGVARCGMWAWRCSRAPSSACCSSCMVLPVALFARSLSLGRRLWLVVVSGLAALVVVSPWFDRQPHPLRRAGAVLHQRRPHDLRRQQPWLLLRERHRPVGAPICGAYLRPLSELGLEAVDAVERPAADRSRLHHRPSRPARRWWSRRASRAVWSVYAPGYMADYNRGEGREALGLVAGVRGVLAPRALRGRRRGDPAPPQRSHHAARRAVRDRHDHRGGDLRPGPLPDPGRGEHRRPRCRRRGSARRPAPHGEHERAPTPIAAESVSVP